MAMCGCKDSLTASSPASEPEEGGLVETSLNLAVSGILVNAQSVTRAAVTAGSEEKRVDNIWVFQYDSSTGGQLIRPRYYTISDQSELENLPVLLKPDKDGSRSNVCVVANTSDSEWGTKNDFSTYGKLKAMALPLSCTPQRKGEESIAIPMEGSSVSVEVTDTGTVTVPVTRMFAKLVIKIELGKNIADKLTLSTINVKRIPLYSRVESLLPEDESKAASYPDDLTWTDAYAFTVTGGYLEDGYIIYVPENIQGTTTNGEAYPKEKQNGAPANALYLSLYGKDTDGNGYTFEKFYPGENNYNNFNIKRNYVYNVTVNIDGLEPQSNPSSNCFLVLPGERLAFEPYYRTETGGGYKFTDYLDPDDETLVKVIDRVGIIWQTENTIGDNSNGDLVWFDKEAKKIYVQTKEEGNALIAAYNKDGEIIWSWHVWVTGNDPANTGNAIIYTTYAWDRQGIKYDPQKYDRISGRAVMTCNLGALSNFPDEEKKSKDTYGMLYQWGRKDPFPPMKTTTKANKYYKYDSDNANIYVYDNSHKQISMTTYGYENDTDELFKTVLTTDIMPQTNAGGIIYSIRHPTIFIAGANRLNRASGGYNNPANYLNRGDWLPGHDEKLWGAVERNENMEYYSYYKEKTIWRNYGDKKTIFDPCPAGWRVPPGDLWLGFTKNGRNVGIGTIANNTLTNINCVDENFEKIAANFGYTMYMTAWKSGKFSFFPTQGSRLASGEPYLGGICGNYHNATSDATVTVTYSTETIEASGDIDRVNILHFHHDGNYGKINTFEDQLLYYVKAVGGPVRCVRDTE